LLITGWRPRVGRAIFRPHTRRRELSQQKTQEDYDMPLALTAARGRSRLARLSVVGAIAGASLIMLAVEAGAVSKRVEKSCTSDYLQFCPQYNEGTPQLRNCMGQAGKRGSLSPRCLRALVDSGMVPRKYLKR
jgi:hypothetical protein